MKKILIVSCAALILSACTPDKIFSLIAKSDVEEASSQLVENTSAAIDQINTVIEAKKSVYSVTAKLESPSSDGSYAYVFSSQYDESDETNLEIVAVLPPLSQAESFYEAWLVDPNTNAKLSMGPLFLDDSNDSRTLSYASQKDLSAYAKVMITAQTNPDQSDAGPVVLEGSWLQGLDEK